MNPLGSATPQPVAAGSEHVLAFESVTKWYGQVVALMDVSFAVGTEVVGLVGRNGAGKSTLMHLAAGLLAPSQGSVLIAGKPAAHRASCARVGFSPDLERLPESLDALTFVAWQLRFHGFTARESRDRAAAVLGDLGMSEHMHRPLRSYSKGMRQRVRLAQALAHGPDLVLLDEPMTGLDPVARADLAQRIRALPSAGVSVLVSSHVLHELESIANRVVCMHQGRVLAEGPLADLRTRLPGAPQRVRVVAASLRELARTILDLPQVDSVAIEDEALVVGVGRPAGFFEALTRIGAEWPGGIHEVAPLGEDLDSVFGHLIA